MIFEAADFSPTAIDDSEFDAVVVASQNPVLVDFWADWCEPCHAIAPTIAAIADEYAGRLAVRKLNVDDNAATAARFGVRSIPTLLLFKDGEVKTAITGLQPRAVVEAQIEPYIDPVGTEQRA